jgi:hypothetical protein
MKIAVIFAGLCNINPDYFKFVNKVYELLGSHVEVHTFFHHWNEENIYLDNYENTSKFYTGIPVDKKEIHEKVHERFIGNPNFNFIYSDVVELANTTAYNDCCAEYIHFVNTTAQFYAFNKILNSYDFSNFDYIIKWRYDLLSETNETLKTILSIIKEKQTNIFHCGGKHTIKTLNIDGLNDIWFMIPSDLFGYFKDIHYEISCIGSDPFLRKSIIDNYETLGLSALVHKSFPIVEHQLLKFIEKYKINIKEHKFESILIRSNIEIPKDFLTAKSDIFQQEFLKSVVVDTPEHMRKKYG